MVWPRLRFPARRGLDEFLETTAMGWDRVGLQPGTLFGLYPFAILRRRNRPGRDPAAGGNCRQPLELWTAFFYSANDHFCLGWHECPFARRRDRWALGRASCGGAGWLYCLDKGSPQAFPIDTSDLFLFHLRRICIRHCFSVYPDGIPQGFEPRPSFSLLCRGCSHGHSWPGRPFFPWGGLGMGDRSLRFGDLLLRSGAEYLGYPQFPRRGDEHRSVSHPVMGMADQ